MKPLYNNHWTMIVVLLFAVFGFMSCGGEEKAQTTADRLSVTQVKEGSITFAGSYENYGGFLSGNNEIESPWVTTHNLGLSRVQTKVRVRLQGVEENWQWPFTIKATAIDAAIGEAGTVYLEAITSGADPSFRSGAYEVVEARFRYQVQTVIFGWETIGTSDWFEVQSQGLADRTSGPAPLAGSLEVPEEYCLNLSIFDLLLSWLKGIDVIIPSDLDPLSVHLCLHHVILGEPLDAGLMAGPGASALSTESASLGSAPVAITMTPSSKEWSFYFGDQGDYRYTPVIEPYGNIQLRTVASIVLWSSGSVKLTTGEEERAFAYYPWPPPDEPYYSGTMPGAIRFDFTAAPGVTGVSPVNGPMAGGTEVTLTGGGFLDVTQVCFGDLCVGPGEFNIISDTEILVPSPVYYEIGEPVTVNITVSAPNGTSPPRDHNRFRYLPPPIVTGIEPSQGLASGGTWVTVTGSGFDTMEAVSFGSREAPMFTVVDSVTVNALSPAGSGEAQVTVTTWCEEEGPLESTLATTCGTSDPAPEPFTYTALVVLNQWMHRALEMSGAASLQSHGKVIINSSAGDALDAAGSCLIWSDPGMDIVGGYFLTGNVVCDPMPAFVDSPSADPLEDLVMPVVEGMPLQAHNLHLMHGTTALLPGLYRGGAVFGGNAAASLAPGIHALEGGLVMLGNATLYGEEDAIVYVFPAEGSDDCGNISIGGNAALYLEGSTQDGFEGISFIVDPLCSSLGRKGSVLVGGNARVTMGGAFYAPSASFRAGPNNKLMLGSLVVDSLEVQGSSELVTGFPEQEEQAE